MCLAKLVTIEQTPLSYISPLFSVIQTGFLGRNSYG